MKVTCVNHCWSTEGNVKELQEIRERIEDIQVT